MARTITITLELEHVTCAACGIAFAMESSFRARRLADHEYFYCPAGHHNYYSAESDAERLSRELKEARLEIRRMAYREQSAQLAARDAERAQKAAEAETRRVKKRAAAALCPCCRRSFVQLRRHMETKHPEYSSA